MAAMPAVHSHFDLDAGHLALDFANTLEGRYDDQPRDLLRTYDDLLGFALEAGAIDAETAEALRDEAALHVDAAAAALAAAIDVRETLFRVYAAVAAGATPASGDLEQLNGWLSRALPHGGIVAEDGRFFWQWESPATDLERPIWPIVHAAMEFLLHGPTDRVRECAADDCGWLFVDTTRNRARRWCSMKSCGNRAKVQQFRERSRGGNKD